LFIEVAVETRSTPDLSWARSLAISELTEHTTSYIIVCLAIE